MFVIALSYSNPDWVLLLYSGSSDFFKKVLFFFLRVIFVDDSKPKTIRFNGYRG